MPEHVSIENQKVQTGELTLRPAKNALIKDRDLHLGNEYAELKRIVKQKDKFNTNSQSGQSPPDLPKCVRPEPPADQAAQMLRTKINFQCGRGV